PVLPKVDRAIGTAQHDLSVLQAAQAQAANDLLATLRANREKWISELDAQAAAARDAYRAAVEELDAHRGTIVEAAAHRRQHHPPRSVSRNPSVPNRCGADTDDERDAPSTIRGRNSARG